MSLQIEKRVLSAALVARASYEELFSRVSPEKFSPLGSATAKLIQDFYEADKDVKKAEKSVLVDRVASTYNNPKQVEAIQAYVSSLNEEISVPNLLLDIKLLKQQVLGEEIALDLVNRADPNLVIEKMTKYQDIGLQEAEENEEIFIGRGVDDLVRTAFGKDNLIKLLPKELNDRIDGGCRPGHHILVYARPEIGKTLVVLNMAAGFLAQDLKVLYIGNEDPASDILLRMITRLSKMTKQQVFGNPEEAEKRAFTKGYGNLVVASLSPGNFFEIRKLVEKYDPAVVVLDQLRNLEVSSDSRVLQLEKAATEARNLAKKYGLVVVSVTQAGDSAEGKSVLGRSDVDFSKTGIPATLDLMIGIGADESMEKHGLRTISLCKNKLSGNHDHFTVSINPSIGTVDPT
jgi:KaiC/GvpD/RAD55 family RecA-like ATPase